MKRDSQDIRPPQSDPDVLERMEIAFDLYDVAERMKRQNIRRSDPSATEREVEERIREWLRDRPGARDGDGVGRVVRPEESPE